MFTETENIFEYLLIIILPLLIVLIINIGFFTKYIHVIDSEIDKIADYIGLFLINIFFCIYIVVISNYLMDNKIIGEDYFILFLGFILLPIYLGGIGIIYGILKPKKKGNQKINTKRFRFKETYPIRIKILTDKIIFHLKNGEKREILWKEIKKIETEDHSIRDVCFYYKNGEKYSTYIYDLKIVEEILNTWRDISVNSNKIVFKLKNGIKEEIFWKEIKNIQRVLLTNYTILIFKKNKEKIIFDIPDSISLNSILEEWEKQKSGSD